MWQRCTAESNISYPNYGGRGIKVCDRWKSFENFYADMGDRPHGKSLDRIRSNEDYTPDNCKWSSRTEQNNNKRNNVFVSIDGRSQTYSQWGKELGIRPSTLRERYIKTGSFEPNFIEGNKMQTPLPHAGIPLTPVKSSKIMAIGHCPVTEVLAVQFIHKGGTGNVYHYQAFTSAEYAAFASAESVGKHFIAHIQPHKDKHPYVNMGVPAAATRII